MSETTAELAVHLAAAAHRADAAALVDSQAFMARVATLGPDTPGFVGRVADAVRQEVEGARRGATEPPAAVDAPEPVDAPVSRNEQIARLAALRAQLTPDYPGEITEEDVRLAAPSVVGEWAAAGKLAHLGVPAQKRRGRR